MGEKICGQGASRVYRKKVFRHVFRSLDSGHGEREVVKRVIPRAHMASATKIHLSQVGLDNFEPSPASPIHAVRTSAGDHATTMESDWALAQGFFEQDSVLPRF